MCVAGSEGRTMLDLRTRIQAAGLSGFNWLGHLQGFFQESGRICQLSNGLCQVLYGLVCAFLDYPRLPQPEAMGEQHCLSGTEGEEWHIHSQQHSL